MRIPSEKPILLVIELDYHVDILGFFLASIDKTRFTVHCIATPAVAAKIPDAGKAGVTVHETTRNKEIVKLLADIGADLVFFNTCASRYRFWAGHCPPNATVRIHNINTSFIPGKSIHIGFNFYELRKAFTHILWRQCIHLDRLYLSRFLRKAASYNFLSETNARYFGDVRPDLLHKKGPVFPSAAYNADFYKENPGTPLRITVPGTLEQKRKDFDAIRRFVRILAGTEHLVELHFAGRIPASSAAFVNELKKSRTDRFEIFTYGDFLPQHVFDELLRSSDLLFFPMIRYTRYKIFREVYGKSKISGSLNDLIRFGKYAVMPEFYDPDPALRPLAFSYDDTEAGMRRAYEAARDSYLGNRNGYAEKVEMHARHYAFGPLSHTQNELLAKLTHSHGKI